MVKFILIKSPDEWATTKQACRDELVVYLFFSSHNIYFALLLCTVLRISSHTFYIYIYILLLGAHRLVCHIYSVYIYIYKCGGRVYLGIKCSMLW